MKSRLKNIKKRNPEVCSNTINIPLLKRKSNIRRNPMNKENTNQEEVNMRTEIAITKVVKAVDVEG